MPYLLDMYPDAFGAHKATVFGHNGPTSYVPMQPGSPAATPIDDGDRVQAIEAGMKLFDFVVGGITDNGLYEVVAVPLSVTTNLGGPTATYGLVWYTISTRTQVTEGTDLSGSRVRLFALGAK